MDYKQSPHLIEVFDFDILHMELNTPLFILALVLVVMFFLHRLLFRPVLRTLDNRAQTMGSLEEAAAKQHEQTRGLVEDYERQLADVRANVAQVRHEGAREAQQQMSVILEQARSEAQQELERAMGELEGEVQQARQELTAAAERLAEQATNRILQA